MTEDDTLPVAWVASRVRVDLSGWGTLSEFVSAQSGYSLASRINHLERKLGPIPPGLRERGSVLAWEGAWRAYLESQRQLIVSEREAAHRAEQTAEAALDTERVAHAATAARAEQVAAAAAADKAALEAKLVRASNRAKKLTETAAPLTDEENESVIPEVEEGLPVDKELAELAKELRAQGKSDRQICAELGVGRRRLARHLKPLGHHANEAGKRNLARGRRVGDKIRSRRRR